MRKNQISLFSGVTLALSSLAGSGWLFGADSAAQVAGPSSVILWIIGVTIMMLIAFNYVKLGIIFPEGGGMSRFAEHSHGQLLGFLSAWANWVSLITLIPIEAVARVQYISSWPRSWANWIRGFFHNGTITNEGLWAVYLFMSVFNLINFGSVKLLTRFTSLIAVFKLLIPSLTIIFLILAGFHSSNFGNNVSTFMLYGTEGTFQTVTVSGIILSYDTFQTAINLAGEIEKPHKNIFWGVWISLSVTAITYVLFEAASVGAVEPTILAKVGWHGVDSASPFADIVILLGLTWLSVLLYMDVFISPFGTDVTFVATSTKTLMAMTRSGNVPAFLGRVNKEHKTPRYAMIWDLILIMTLVFFFRNWSELATVVSVSTFVAHATGPIVAISLRKVRPNFKRPFKSVHLKWVASVSFALTGLVIYWAVWPTTIEVIFVVLLGLPIYFYCQFKKENKDFAQQFKSSLWLLSFLAFISIISYLGSSALGENNTFKYPWDFVIVILASIGFYIWGVKSSYDGEDLKDAEKVNKDVRIED